MGKTYIELILAKWMKWLLVHTNWMHPWKDRFTAVECTACFQSGVPPT